MSTPTDGAAIVTLTKAIIYLDGDLGNRLSIAEKELRAEFLAKGLEVVGEAERGPVEVLEIKQVKQGENIRGEPIFVEQRRCRIQLTLMAQPRRKAHYFRLIQDGGAWRVEMVTIEAGKALKFDHLGGADARSIISKRLLHAAEHGPTGQFKGLA